MKSNNKKTLRYAFWMGMLPVGVILAMALTIGGTVMYNTIKAETPEKPVVDTVVVEKEVIRYIDTPKPAPRPVVVKPAPVKPVEPQQTTDTTSN